MDPPGTGVEVECKIQRWEGPIPVNVEVLSIPALPSRTRCFNVAMKFA